MEIRLLSDPEYATEFDVTVQQIIDRYVAGEFRGADLDRVRGYFLKSEQRQEKLRFALALKEQKAKRSSVNEPVKTNYSTHLKVAAMLLVVIGIGYFAWYRQRPQPDLLAGLTALQAAFPDERPIEGRLSDFNYVPLPNQRGGSGKVDHVQRELAATFLLKSVRDNPTASSHHAAAKYYLMLRQFDEANKEFTAALALEPHNAKIHSDFGAALLEEGRAENSAADNSRQLELYGRSLKHIEKALEVEPSLQEALFNRALVFQFMRPSEQAKEAWNAYLQKDSSSRWAEEARRNIKIIEQEQQKTSRGQHDNHQLFLAALRNSDDDAAWNIVSANYTSAGNDIANRLLDSLLGIKPFDEKLDSRETLAALQYVAKLENDRTGDRFTSDLVSNYSRAGPRLKTLLTTARQHMRTAYSSFEKNRFPEAIDEYHKAKSIYEQTHDTVETIFVEYRLAHCYVLQPDTQRALAAFSRLLAMSESNQYRWLIAQSLYGLANANVHSSEYSKALDYSAQALTKFHDFGDPNGVVKCLTQLADFNQAINRIPAALGSLNRALRITNQLFSDARQRWGVLNQIGFSMTSLQLHAAALFYQKEALHLAKELSVPLLISRSYSYLGSAYAAMQMYPQAVNEATQAFEYGGSVTGKRGLEIMAHSAQQLGDIHRAAGECDRAIENYDRSLGLYRRINIDYYSYAAHKGKLHCFIASSDKQAVRKEFQLVLGLSELYRSKITDENQRSSFFDAEQAVYDLAIGYEFGVEKDYEKALEYSEKSRARSLLDAVERSARMRTKTKITALESAVVTRPLRVSEIQARMSDAAQLVQYALLEDKLIIWVINPNYVKQKELSLNTKDFNDKVNAFLETLNHPPADVAFKPDQSTELFNTLIKPVENYLDKSKALVLIPDKILHYLPFAALASQATPTYLIDDYEVSVAPSATLFVNLSAAAERLRKRGNDRLVSVGDPIFDRKTFNSLRPLPSSFAEAREVAQRYPDHHKLLVREEATETAVKREIEKAGLVHLAMHFVLNEQSEMLSGFPLTPETSDAPSHKSDGFLQSFEIAHLNLRHTRLAVLSACQTGIEKQYRGEGAIGAARPFFVAGVPTVVASLWPVDSDASAELMVSFHRHRLERLSTGEALRLAQREMIKSSDARRSHPYYWAPFLAIGGIAGN